MAHPGPSEAEHMHVLLQAQLSPSASPKAGGTAGGGDAGGGNIADGHSEQAILELADANTHADLALC